MRSIKNHEVTTIWRGLTVSGIVSTDAGAYVHPSEAIVEDVKIQVDGRLGGTGRMVWITADASQLYDTKTCEEIEAALILAVQGD